MAAIPPGALIPWIEQRFLKLILDSVTQKPLLVPNAMGFLQSFASNGVTPKPTYSSPGLEPGLANPVTIQFDDDGRPPTNLYMGRGGYTFVVKADDGTTLYTVSAEDTASYFANMGASQAEGAKDVTNGYQAVSTDHYITTNANEITNPSVMILPDRTTWEGGFLIVKNKSAVTWQLTPFGTQTIEGINSAVLLGPAAGGNHPTIIFLPVEGGWDIVSATSTGVTLPANLAYLNIAQNWTAPQTFASGLAIGPGTFQVGGFNVTVTADCVLPGSGGGGPLPPNLAYTDQTQTWTGYQSFDAGLSFSGHDLGTWLNQPVRTDSDPIFKSLYITDSLIVEDNISLNGRVHASLFGAGGMDGITRSAYVQMGGGGAPDQRLQFVGGICVYWGN